MTGKWYNFIFARDGRSLAAGSERVLSLIWNSLAFLLSSAALCAVSLNFAIGDMPLFYIYLGYFKSPMIFLLNWLPILLLQAVMLSIFGRQWLAFLANSILTMIPALGNYYKLKFRDDPFTFEDISSIGAGLKVAGDYDLTLNARIVLALLFVAAATLILLFFARRIPGKKLRVVLSLLAVCSVWPLWRSVYSNGELYAQNYANNYMWLAKDSRDSFISTGFPYPFLHSISLSANVHPDGYDEQETAELLSTYQSAEIPEDRKLHIMAIQLESFSDFEAAGVKGISEEVYKPLRELQAESCCGTMIANVIGGGTINAERGFVSGSFRQMDYHRQAFSYVRYLNAQGYLSYATHPNAGHFYTRDVTDRDLGFSEFYGLDNYFQEITGGEIQCDDTYLPEIFRMFRERISGGEGPVFSFNVSWQGHGPYSEEAYEYGVSDLWAGEGASDTTKHAFNNYLALITETQQILLNELRALQSADEPVVVLLYGDHKPLFSDEVYAELGIELRLDSREKLEAYLGTPYLIWANDAAKNLTGEDFCGTGPTVSPCYLMNLLFDRLSWDGPAFMQFTGEVLERIPVICTRGAYIEDGIFKHELSPEGAEMVRQYANLQYYLRYRPELSE